MREHDWQDRDARGGGGGEGPRLEGEEGGAEAGVVTGALGEHKDPGGRAVSWYERTQLFYQKFAAAIEGKGHGGKASFTKIFADNDENQNNST